MNKQRSGAELICDVLASLGVEHVFGLPGTQNVQFFEALRRSRLRTVLATHELSAAFMANGYARASGRVGVLVTIPGPGFAYALAGLAEARLDSAPVLHVVGQPPPRSGRIFQHQEIQQSEIAQALAKAVVEVDRVSDLADAVRCAFALALSGEPGPVVLHVSTSAMSDMADAFGDGEGAPAPAATQDASAAVLELLGTLVANAERPLLFVGLGASGAPEAIQRLAERLTAPVLSTPSGRGTLPEDHPLSLRFDFDNGGLGDLNKLLARADLVLALGCKFSFNGTGGFKLALRQDQLVHVNTDGRALGANYPARLEIEASVESVVESLHHTLDDSLASSTWNLDEVADEREKIASGANRRPEPRIQGVASKSPEQFFASLRAALPRDGILVTDSGLHQALTRRHFKVLGPRGLLMPTDFQSMGFGLPAAIGAYFAHPDRSVVALIGDGGLSMSGMELVTLAREGLPITVIVFNDGFLNLIRVQQLADYGHSHAVTLQNPDFEALAMAMGIAYVRLEGSAEETLRGAIQGGRPTLIEVVVGDSPQIRSMGARAALKSAARGVISDQLWQKLKRLGGRS